MLVGVGNQPFGITVQDTAGVLWRYDRPITKSTVNIVTEAGTTVYLHPRVQRVTAFAPRIYDVCPDNALNRVGTPAGCLEVVAGSRIVRMVEGACIVV